MDFSLYAADPLEPKFNYALIGELKNTGSYDILNRPVGEWTEYAFDSTYRKMAIDKIDHGKNLYPPHRIVILKSVGVYVDGKRTGLWKTYKSYDNKVPLKWDLMETWSYVSDHCNGPWRYYYNDGKLLSEADYSNDKLHGIFKSYSKDGILLLKATYNKGVLDGPYEDYSRSGVLVWKGYFKNGAYDGEINVYYPNGQLKSSIEYKEGMPWNILGIYDRMGNRLDGGTLSEGTGSLKSYNQGAGLDSYTDYTKGKGNGWYVSYFLNGNVESEIQMLNDSLTGTVRKYYYEGGLKYEGQVIDGNHHGLSKDYYRNGKLKAENIYRNGKLWATVSAKGLNGESLYCGNMKMGTGVIVRYDDSARIEIKSTFSYGTQEGVCETYYTNGQIETSARYAWGLMNGEYKTYDKQGRLKLVALFRDEEQDGQTFSYHSNGRIFQDLYYYNGRLWEASIYDSTGRKMNSGSFTQGTGTVRNYSESGTLIRTGEMVYGLNHGKTIHYFANGMKEAEYHYEHDNLTGVQEQYWPNGNVAAIWTVHDGQPDGTLVQYHADGKPWTVWNYEKGLVWSVDYNYSVNGEPHDIGTFKNGTGNIFRYDEKDSVIFVAEFRNGYCLNCALDTVQIR